MTIRSYLYLKFMYLTLLGFALCLIATSCASPSPSNILIVKFTADPPKINDGDTVTLSWAVVDASSCSIIIIAEGSTKTDPEAVACQATKQDAPERTKTYRLLAKAIPGSEKRDEQAEVIVLVTAIVRFEADKTEIQSGEKVTLFWEAVNTDSCFITFLQGDKSSEPQSVLCKGSQTFAPSDTTTYRFSALKTDGKTFLEKRLTVLVTPVVGL